MVEHSTSMNSFVKTTDDVVIISRMLAGLSSCMYSQKGAGCLATSTTQGSHIERWETSCESHANPVDLVHDFACTAGNN